MLLLAHAVVLYSIVLTNCLFGFNELYGSWISCVQTRPNSVYRIVATFLLPQFSICRGLCSSSLETFLLVVDLVLCITDSNLLITRHNMVKSNRWAMNAHTQTPMRNVFVVVVFFTFK